MSRFPIYQIDAFTRERFHGNPAAVCLLDEWPEDGLLQAIAQENNLSETAFLVRGDPQRRLRWFTPATEVDLCGHATLATAFVLARFVVPEERRFTFATRSGALTVVREGDRFVMDFPAQPARPVSAPTALIKALGAEPLEAGLSADYLLVLEDEAAVRALEPDMRALAAIPGCRGFIATAPGDEADFVSRFFAPGAGVAEDPVTGSAHCTLTPYWSARLGKTRLKAHQVSARGGELECEDRGERVAIAGHAVAVVEGTLLL